MTLKITNPQGQTQTYFDVTKIDYYDGVEHIELKDGTRFTVNTWKGWRIIVI